eukprot:CAMPEP_0116939610 /NCGR_PEP_ID=MMETSP0467-20121206/32840_1 /TAXON_ID=283647 /ORGANISM="Mesodinium pulex, Strain SPMC105" /LENGTH=67 /DNA_ID=CAMNT_0004621925 /DNA_START=269 /DNA_END=472 /DNA_ORIENTATION=+
MDIADREAIQYFGNLFQVQGIPHLGVLDMDLNVVEKEARMKVVDNQAKAFEDWVQEVEQNETNDSKL